MYNNIEHNIKPYLIEKFEKVLKKARKETDKNPTEPEKKAGNYKKGKVNINGFLITLENPKGSYRRGKDRNGKEWKTLMKHDYGYFNSTVGKDGDAIDVFIGPRLESKKIFCIDQKINGEFDETKVMFCFSSEYEAKRGYLACYEKDWKGFWKITEVDIETFKKWLYDGHKQRKPFCKYVEIQKKKLNEELDRDEENEANKVVDDNEKETSNILFWKFEKSDDGVTLLKVNGGLNGCGEWDNYLKDILDLYEKLDDRFKVWIVNLDVDCLDDTFCLTFGIDKKEEDKLNENIELEATYPKNFSMEQFLSIKSYAGRAKYCEDRLYRLASGSSRIVYMIDNKTVLKLAKNRKGIAQNMEESRLGHDDWFLMDLNLFAKVYEYDKQNYTFVEMEFARKARENDFKRVTGYDFNMICAFIDWMKQKYTYGKMIRDNQYDKMFEEILGECDSNNIFYKLEEYIGNYTPNTIGDLKKLSSWGVAYGQGGEHMVLIDYGLSDDVCKQYYNKKR